MLLCRIVGYRPFLFATFKDDQRSKGTLWTSDVSSSGPQILTSNQGSFRPVYLQLHNGSEGNRHYSNDRGFSLLPSRLDAEHPWSSSLDGSAREKLSQTWPPPSSTAATATSSAQEVRVLTPTQLRGRRMLQPIGTVDRSPDNLVSTRGLPKRDLGTSGSRYKMPPLSSPKRQDKADEINPVEHTRPPEISVEDLRTSRSPDKSRIQRRQQLHNRTLPAKETREEMLRLDHVQTASVRRKGTPPLLVDPAPQDCTIPQKPVLVRQPVRQETPPDGAHRRPPSGSAHTPPAEPFLPPVDAAAAAATQGRGRVTAAPIPLADELVFQSLESFDQEETAAAATVVSQRPESPEKHGLSKCMPQHRSSGALDEENERNMKFQMLKEEEAERISRMPPSPASAPPAICPAPEVVELSPPMPPSEKPPPAARALAPGTPPDQAPQQDAPGDVADDGAAGEAPLAVLPVRRARRCIIPRQLKRNSVAPMPREAARSRQLAKQSGTGFMLPDLSKPLDKPRDSLQMYFHQLDSQEWEVVIQGLQTLVRLCRHHQGTVQAHLHSVLVALGRQIRNLRSQVSRAACQAAGELFLALKRAVETDLDEVAVPLFHRAADTNKFLRADSNAALDLMVEVVSTNRAVTAICCKGATHQHALVRTAAARLLTGIVTKLGAERTMSLPRDTRDRILVTGANLLTEGSLDTRCFAKQMFRVLSTQHNFIFVMTEVVPVPVMRNISKTLQALK